MQLPEHNSLPGTASINVVRSQRLLSNMKTLLFNATHFTSIFLVTL